MSLVSRGSAAHKRRAKLSAGVSITYARGVDSVELTAWEGRTLFAIESRQEGAARVQWGDKDYLIVASELILDGDTVTPREGDRITQTLPEGDVTFEVLPPNRGEPAWRYSDPQRTILRVHVKEVA